MSYNTPDYDFTNNKQNVEILDSNNNKNYDDDIKIELDEDSYNNNAFNNNNKGEKDWGFLSNNNQQASNSSTRPDSITNTNNENISNEKKDNNTMVEINTQENVKEVKTVQVKSSDYMSKVYYRPGNTLQEPIKETFKRDLSRIYEKIKYVLKFKKTEEEEAKAILDWDLWGPLLLCILLAR